MIPLCGIMEVSVRRTSRAHSKGCFAKKFYDLPKANLSHAGECLKSGILPDRADYLIIRERGMALDVIYGALPEIPAGLF